VTRPTPKENAVRSAMKEEREDLGDANGHEQAAGE
jgi:hypothetical protein